MPKSYTSFEIDVAFDKIWDFWPNKESRHAGKKALSVLLKSGECTFDEIHLACHSYLQETEGDEFHFQLNNFINKETWRDVLETLDIEKLEEQRISCIFLIDSWNNACHSHWCKSVEYGDKISLTKKALSDKLFNANWERALKDASGIFKYKFRDGDSRQKIILSLRWFCNVSSSQHTVMRIIEGEYGSPLKEVEKKEVKVVERTKEDIARFKKLWSEIKEGKKLNEDDDEPSEGGIEFELM